MTTSDKSIPIYIDQEALENTIAYCEKEQSVFMRKYNSSMSSILLRALCFEMRYYLIFSILGLILILLLSNHNPNDILFFISVYCFGQGLLIIFEFYKTNHYHLSEITSPVYLHPGRMLLIRSASAGVINIIIFASLCLMVILLTPEHLTKLIIFLLIPIYLLQIVMIYIVPYIRSMMAAITCYCIALGSSRILYEALHVEITLEFALLQLAIILTIFIVSLLKMYFKQKGETHGTFIRTH